MKIKIFNREICVRALLDTNSLCAKSSAEMRYKNGTIGDIWRQTCAGNANLLRKAMHWAG